MGGLLKPLGKRMGVSMRILFWRHVAMLLVGGALVACAQPAAAPTATGSVRSAPEATVSDVSQAGNETVAPASGAEETHGEPVVDHVSFVDYLRGKGLTVELAGDVQQPFLRAAGTVLRVSGGDFKQPVDIQSYNYDDTDLGTEGAKAAEEDASQLGPDGNPRTTMITWIAPPHFFRKERIIALYIGDDPAVVQLLAEALGPQFAGR